MIRKRNDIKFTLSAFYVVALIIAFFFTSCKIVEILPNEIELPAFLEQFIPAHFPNIEEPENNIATKERVALGKMLFNDKRLSRNETLSCASCHKTELAFSDPINVESGNQLGRGKRNAPTLANVAYHPYFFREGGNPTLELQVQAPIQDEEEFNFSFPELLERLKTDEVYQNLAAKTYQRELDAFVITRAIAAYERTLISGNSKFDNFFYTDLEVDFGESEINGYNLFFSERLNCTKCHEGFDFTNYKIENNGIYATYNDFGLFRITNDTLDIGKFKIPTLRNIEVSAPYMFDGSFETLEEVIEHYNEGGKNHPNQSEFIKPLNLSTNEKLDLIAFLKTLTDYDFIKN